MTTNKEIVASIEGMHCSSCAKLIESVLIKEAGVKSVRVNQATESARLVLDTETQLSSLNEKLSEFGYGLKVSGETDKTNQSRDEERQKSLTRERNFAMLTFPWAILMAVLMLWEVAATWSQAVPIFFLPMELMSVIALVIASIVLFSAGWDYVKAVGRFLIKWRGANMDTLVGFGTMTAYLYSAMVLLMPEVVRALDLSLILFFDVVVVVIGFVRFGKYLEAKAKLSTSRAIERLINLQAKSAMVEVNGKEMEVAINEVQIDAVVIIKPGDKIPLDGIVISGESSVDESLLTGESMPIEKSEKSQVYAGSINQQGYFKFRVTQVNAETMLAKIIAKVDEAQSSKAPIERLADAVSSYFVPAVLIIAVVTLIAWLWIGTYYFGWSTALSLGLTCFVGVLVIACPCALGLATPMGIIVGVELATMRGILIKKAESLEKLSRVKVVLFDKTGTLTVGKPKLTDLETVSGYSVDKVLEIAASLEKKSEHPLAMAIMSMAQEKNLTLSEISSFVAMRGQGVSGIIDQKKYYLGNQSLMAELGLSLERAVMDRLSKQAKTVMTLASDTEIIAWFAVADALKTETKQTIVELKKLGVTLVMLTGDKRETALAIAKEAGIENVEAEVMPEAKADLVKKYQSQGMVAMIGDGVNDAIALTTADVGVAMATGSDIAIESADITLLHGDLSKLLAAIKISRLTLSKIKQNLFLAFIYNILAIPVAAGAWYASSGLLLNPGLAAAAMSLSSLSVVVNTLLMRKARIM